MNLKKKEKNCVVVEHFSIKLVEENLIKGPNRLQLGTTLDIILKYDCTSWQIVSRDKWPFNFPRLNSNSLSIINKHF